VGGLATEEDRGPSDHLLTTPSFSFLLSASGARVFQCLFSEGMRECDDCVCTSTGTSEKTENPLFAEEVDEEEEEEEEDLVDLFRDKEEEEEDEEEGAVVDEWEDCRCDED